MNPKMKQILDKLSLGRNEVIITRFCKESGVSRQGLYNILDYLKENGYIKKYYSESIYGRKDKVNKQTIIEKIKA